MIPAPPSVNGRRHPAFADTECYPNYWLLRFKPLNGAIFSFELHAGERFTRDQVADMLALFQRYCTITFNGNGYDKWMITYALSGVTPAELKMMNDKIIVERIKPWELGLERDIGLADHIDLMEVAPGAGSQKQYAGRIHARTMRDLPYPPDQSLTPEQIREVFNYCGNDLAVLEHLFHECEPLLQLRENLSERYGMDLRSKSDAQLAEAVLKKRCEEALGKRIYKDGGFPSPQWMQYKVPAYIGFNTPELQHALELIRREQFYIDPFTGMQVPESISKLTINLGRSSYKIGVGGLHSQEKCVSYRSDEQTVLLSPDVASYYPNLIVNSGEFPPVLGETFRSEFRALMQERLAAKETQGKLKKAGDTSSPQYVAAKTMNEGGKIMINGTFGKTGNAYSVLFAPSMLLQTTITGQLALLMLIEWHELYGIPVVSANTDGIVLACPRNLVGTSKALIAEWERRTTLTMELTEFRALHARDVNSYFAITSDGEVKRKGEYAKAGLVEKKNPDVEICSDAVADFLANGTAIELSIYACRDIRKFVTIQKVTGGGIKMWGEGPRKDDKVRDMIPRLEANGWVKHGHKWVDPLVGQELPAAEAYAQTFMPQRPEYLGKVVRWYYSTMAPGPIVYAARNAVVSLSYGAKPCMTLPDVLPADIDYRWYIDKAYAILDDVGYRW